MASAAAGANPLVSLLVDVRALSYSSLCHLLFQSKQAPKTHGPTSFHERFTCSAWLADSGVYSLPLVLAESPQYVHQH